MRRSVRRARRRLRLPPQACQQQQLAAERAAVRLRNDDYAPRSGPELHEAWRRGAPCNDVDETLAICAARGAPLALAQLEGDDAGVVQHTLAYASAGGASSSRLLQQATHRARKKLLERLLLVVVLNAVLAFTARVSAAWFACCTSYALIWLLSRIAAHAHGSHCRIWTCMVFGVACGVHVGPMAALLGAFWPLGLPKSCLWWPSAEVRQQGRMDEFERFVRANRVLLQTRHHERPKETGAPHIELLQNVLRQKASKATDPLWQLRTFEMF